MKIVTLMAAVTLLYGAGEAVAADSPKQIAVVIKATDSDFWQYLTVGANNYAAEHPDIKVTIYGAASETDVDKQVSILENLVAKKVAGMLVTPSSSDAPAPVLRQAADAGIAVVTADNRVTGSRLPAFGDGQPEGWRAGGRQARRGAEVPQHPAYRKGQRDQRRRGD